MEKGAREDSISLPLCLVSGKMDFDKFLFIVIILAEKRGYGARLVHSHRMSMDITSCIEDMDLNLLSLFGMNCSEEIGMEMMDQTHIDDDLCHLPLHCLLLIFAHLLDVKLLTACSNLKSIL